MKAAYETSIADKRAKRVALLEILRQGRRMFVALDFTHEGDEESK